MPMTYPFRFWLVCGVLCLGLAGLVWRVADLMIFQRYFLLNQGDARSLRSMKIPAYRGMITDRNGEPLAVSVPVNAIIMDPKKFAPDAKQLHQLSQRLSLKTSVIKKTYQLNAKRRFAYLIRGVAPHIGAEVEALDIPGIFVRREFRRFYPEGEATAHLVGFTNIDDRGQEGIELAYEHWLHGASGKKRVLKDRKGHVIANVGLLKSAVPGHDLQLSIDRRIQYLAYQALKNAVQEHQAASGSVIVLSAKTGELLAMVNQPSYNPNNRPKIHDGRFRNRAMTDLFEPGSTMKAFSVANALASGKYKPDTVIDTRPGWMMVQKNVVQDDANYGVLTVTGVLKKSSNIGVTKLTLSLPPNSLFDLLKRVGFGKKTGTGFPGENPGVLDERVIYHPFALATLSFGYGMAITNIQLAQAYSIIANNGIKYPISLLHMNKQAHGERILSEAIAHNILLMMESVIEKGGTATRAEVVGYRVSGKTGTVRMVGRHGYQRNHHTGSFVGIAPIEDPQLIVSVVIKDPKKDGFYGGLVAAPVFSKVMGGALRIMQQYPIKQKA